MQWDIGEAAPGVVRSVGEAVVGEYAPAVAAVGREAEGFEGSLTHAPGVYAVLTGFMESAVDKPLLSSVGYSLGAIRGTAGAIQCYQAGDEQMAADAQRKAREAYFPKELGG